MSRWTYDLCERLIKLKKAGKTSREVAAELGCGFSERAINARWVNIRRALGMPIDAPGRPSKNGVPVRESRKVQTDMAGTRRVIATEAAKQARASLPEPVSTTALLCGDPLPGRSALDQKRGVPT